MHVLILLACHVHGQKEWRPLYDLNEWQNKGWFFAPGITTMLPGERSREEVRIVRPEGINDTLYNGRFRAGGRIGLYAEAGRHHFTNKIYFVDHLDYGVHVKMLRGVERFEGKVGADSVKNEGRFAQTFAGVFFNASNIARIGKSTWIHNSLGVNADFRVLSNVQYDGPTTGMNQRFPNAFLGQLHYKIGFGWKPDPGIYIMPMIETPILTVVPMDDGKSTLQYFSTRYRPIIITLRILLLDRREGRSCDNMPNAGNVNPDKSNPGKSKSSDLFGRDVNQKKLKKRKSKN
jgi:hypothetical protein